MQDFDEYIRQGEPDKIEKAGNWQTAIGLQQVDGLKPSAYLIEQAKLNIEGDITIDEVKNRIDVYYKTHPSTSLGVCNDHSRDNDRTEEADKVSANVTAILSEKTFNFSPVHLISIHRRLFADVVPKIAGKIRDYNITKSEWVLDGKTVLYSPEYELRDALDYDFAQEKAFNYKGLSKTETIRHIAKFISGLWQIHAFGEGNSRTTAVFTIKYLRSFGYDVNNDSFAEHSWYFRNALVRANFRDQASGIEPTLEYLNRFFDNLLLGEKNELKNRFLHIRYKEKFHAKANKLGAKENTPNLLGVNNKKLGANQNKLGKKLNKNQLKMLDLMENNDKTTIVEMAKLLSISETAVENNIKKLREKGIILRVGSDKTGHWKIIECESLDAEKTSRVLKNSLTNLSRQCEKHL
ncbi:cell filamentation protein Fic [Fibrobacterales bacterium]|nr:cell filamentation protein Fic [Fibrobacterales bacterium]